MHNVGAKAIKVMRDRVDFFVIITILAGGYLLLDNIFEVWIGSRYAWAPSAFIPSLVVFALIGAVKFLQRRRNNTGRKHAGSTLEARWWQQQPSQLFSQ